MAMTVAERSRRYRERNREKFLDSQRKYRAKNQGKRRAALRAYERRRREETRTALINGAGGTCVKCGFSDVRALNIDHVNDDGHLELGKTNTVKYQRHVLKMIESGRYQILCANCNQIKEWDRRRKQRDDTDRKHATLPKRLAGKQRKITDRKVRMLREWKPFKELCQEIGITARHGSNVRNGYYHKQPSP